MFSSLASKFRGTSSVDSSKPVVVLGETYSPTPEQRAAFEKRVKALIYFSYRTDLPALASSGYTSDCGWGCLLRSAQMLVAESLQRVLRTRGLSDVSPWERRVIELFADDADSIETSPFCINALLQVAKQGHSRRAGEHFGPSLVAQLVDGAFRRFESTVISSDAASDVHRLLDSFNVYVARDATIYWPDVLTQLRDSRQHFRRVRRKRDSDSDTNTHAMTDSNANPSSDGSAHANAVGDSDADASSGTVGCLLIVPLKLGAEPCLDSRYARWLRFALDSPSCVGFVGGRKPRHGVYVCGYQTTVDADSPTAPEAVQTAASASVPVSAVRFVCLDPHIVQRTVPIWTASATGRNSFPTESYHISTAQGALDAVRATKMDSSLAVGFLVHVPLSILDVADVQPSRNCKLSREILDAFINCDTIVHFQAEVDRVMQRTCDDESHPETPQRPRRSSSSSSPSKNKRLLPLISFSEMSFAQLNESLTEPVSRMSVSSALDSTAGFDLVQVDPVDDDFVLL